MKTTSYNPSNLEIEIANALTNLNGELQKHLNDKKIDVIVADTKQDNPSVKISITDNDGDVHEVVLKIVQLPDKL
jgi:hypothetical protein